MVEQFDAKASEISALFSNQLDPALNCVTAYLGLACQSDPQNIERQLIFSVATQARFVIVVGIIHTVCMKATSMTTAEKISIALPPEMVLIVRAAVATGEYASSSEVIRDALRDWTYKRCLRMQGIAELRGVWQEALSNKTPGISADDVLNRRERKYQAIANAAAK